MARTRATTYDAQRQLILETAAGAFAELGFPSASMNDIAARCGVSKGLLYHYYTSKEQLLFDLTEQYTRRLVAIAEDAERRLAEPAARLEKLIRGFLDEYQTSQSRHMVLLHDLRFLPERERAIVVGNERRVIEVFAAAIRAAYDLPRQLPASRAATMMLFGMLNWTFTWLKPPGAGTAAGRAGRMTYADYAEMVVKVFGTGLAALVRDREIANGTKQRRARRTSPVA